MVECNLVERLSNSAFIRSSVLPFVRRIANASG